VNALSDWLLTLNIDSFVNAHDWVWPLCEILHFFGMALLIGTVGLVDLRILGAVKGLPIRALEKLVPLGVAGFIVNAITGFIFVAGNVDGAPIYYLVNTAFRIKMILILLAGINVLLFYVLGIARETDAVGPAGSASGRAKVVAASSLVAWFAVVLFGRLIMYNDTLLYFLGL
jgi:hypothetical protein